MDSSFTYKNFHYGLFVHYVAPAVLYADGRRAKTIDEAADGFDVQGFADNLEEMHIEYLIFTAWHYRIRPLYPSAVMEKWRPENCARRDLISEIIDAVAQKGIRVILYTHPRDGHDLEDEDRIRTGWGLGHEEGKPDTPNPETFNFEKWNNFMLSLYVELMEKYAKRIDGIYIDGMGPGRYEGGVVGSQSYEFPIIDYYKIRKITKAANPNIVLIQNYFGYKFTCDFVMPEGFFGYENKHTDTSIWPACEKALAFTCFNSWSPSAAKGPGVTKITPEDAARFTIFQSTCSTAGGVAWASGPYCGGGWETNVMETMKEVGRYIERLGESVKNVVPSASWPTVSGDTLESRGWVVAASSGDMAYEYIHIMKKPENGTITLSASQDGACFTKPVVINCGAVVTEFRQDEHGLYMRLEGKLDELDTVVRLERHNTNRAPIVEWRNDTDIRIFYSGEWIYDFLTNSEDKIKFHGNFEYDAHITERNGDWWRTVFKGDTIEIIGPICPDGGIADVLIDNINVGKINNIAPERSNRRILFNSGQLYGGIHELKVIKTGGYKLELDAVRIIR